MVRAGAPLALIALLALVGASPAAADHGSLPRGPGQRPGPSVLYAPPARAPQLTNAGVWRAQPILISGASAYRRGEFLYQDFLYDDHGARGARDPRDPRAAGDLFSPPNGTYTYPTGPAYAGNAADLVELRVKPLRTATAFRITLNTLIDPAVVAATIAIGSSPAPRPFPHGANASAPAALFLTVHGHSADLLDAATGAPAGAPPSVTVDVRRRQIQVLVPHADWNPGGGTVRLAAGAGLWDQAHGTYLLPRAAADADHPGGAGSLARPTALFNVAFRHGEAAPALDTSALTDPAWWRDRAQGAALRSGDLSAFHADVDFARLRAGANDDLVGRPEGVPRYGAMDRILASHFETRQGTDYATVCGLTAPSCQGQLRGRLQPYAIYVPGPRPRPSRYGLTLLLHSLSANYNQYLGSRNQREFATRSPGSIVITPEGRGPDGFDRDVTGADTFEVWADVASRYRLDPSLTSVAGYSMGGFSTFKLAAQYPDLFARAQPTVGAGYPATAPSLRWVPVLMWNSRNDELVPPTLFGPIASALGQQGYRYELDVYAPLALSLPVPGEQHLQLAINDEYGPAADFLGTARVVRDPPHVSYVYDPRIDFPRDGTTADHAYWLSRIRLRNPTSSPTASLDVVSEGFGRGDPKPSGVTMGAGVLTGGTLGPRPFASQRQTWGPTPRRPVRDRLDITATNVADLTIDAARARVTCAAKLAVHSDGPTRVRLVDCPLRRARRSGGRR